MYQMLEFHVRGVVPLLMHNKELANPFNSYVKEMKKLTSKRKKTEEDILMIADLEFMGGLYVDDQSRPILPGELIEATLVAAAKKTRQGTNAKSAIFVPKDAVLIYDGPKKPEALRDNPAFRHTTLVSVNKARVLRTRPKFKAWEAKFTAHYLPEVFNEDEVTGFVQTAGCACGFGDNHPRFGRFELVSVGGKTL